MKVISTTDKSRYGNDCYIKETVSLVEQFDMYAIIVFRKVTGWFENEDVFVKDVTTDYNVAVAKYEDCGGILEY